MIFKNVENYETRYQVSNTGVVKRTRTNKILKYRLRAGYPSITLCKENTKKDTHIHRLVAQAFIPNPFNLPCVNHKDGNKENNNSSNLEWCTHKENSNHAVKLGLISKNTCIKRNPLARHLSQEQAQSIRQEFVKGSRTQGARALGRKYKIPHTAVLLIIKNKTYTH